MDREPGWIGRKDRNDVDIGAVVTRPDGSKLQVRVVNISDGGCRVQSDQQLWIGEYVTLEMPGLGRRRAKIHWALLKKAGLSFLAS